MQEDEAWKAESKANSDRWEAWWSPEKEEERRRTIPAVWKTVTLGTMSLDGYREALSNSHYEVSELILRFLTHPLFKIASESVEVDLVRVPMMRFTENLGGVHLREMFTYARDCGLANIPHEAIFALALQHSNLDNDQSYPYGKDIFLGADPLDGRLLPRRPEDNMYYLGISSGRPAYREGHRAKGPHLCHTGNEFDLWKGGYFMFVKRR